MFTLRVTYLTGRVYSAAFDDGDLKTTPEWPPHPSRLFSALVAAWGEGGAEPELVPALEWLEQQPPPTIHAGEHSVRDNVQAYVPVNDKLTLPEDRPRKGRTFPSASLTTPDVFFVWNAAPPDHIPPLLDRILLRTCSLGHSASLVSVEIAAPPQSKLNEWHPQPGNDSHRLRIPSAGRLAELTAAYARFQTNPNKINRPSRGKTQLYSQASEKDMDFTPTPTSIFDRMIILKRETGPRASLLSTLSLTQALRGAIIAGAPQPPPEFLTGHAPHSTPDNPTRSEHPHIAFAPLPFADYPHGTGEIMGLAALLPATFTREQSNLCWTLLESITRLTTHWGDWDVSVTDAEEQRKNLLPNGWRGPATTWSTVTPVVFDRYPKDIFSDEAAQIVAQSFTRIGLPEPIEISLHYNPWHTGVPKASQFPPLPSRPGKPQRFHCHVRARFDTAVQGPIVVGAGRYLGYGLFKPFKKSEAQ